MKKLYLCSAFCSLCLVNSMTMDFGAFLNLIYQHKFPIISGVSITGSWIFNICNRAKINKLELALEKIDKASEERLKKMVAQIMQSSDFTVKTTNAIIENGVIQERLIDNLARNQKLATRLLDITMSNDRKVSEILDDIVKQHALDAVKALGGFDGFISKNAKSTVENYVISHLNSNGVREKINNDVNEKLAEYTRTHAFKSNVDREVIKNIDVVETIRRDLELENRKNFTLLVNRADALTTENAVAITMMKDQVDKLIRSQKSENEESRKISAQKIQELMAQIQKLEKEDIKFALEIEKLKEQRLKDQKEVKGLEEKIKSAQNYSFSGSGESAKPKPLSDEQIAASRA